LLHDAAVVMAVGRTTEILDDVRRQLAPSNDILVEARTQRERVLDAAKAHGGVRDTYNSGSIAHGTANSDLDADCGVVLDRRTYPNLGPDGDGEGSKDIVSEFRDFVAEKLREDDDRVEVRVTKRRAIRARFNNSFSSLAGLLGTSPAVLEGCGADARALGSGSGGRKGRRESPGQGPRLRPPPIHTERANYRPALLLPGYC
jgi:hypothetical protein